MNLDAHYGALGLDPAALRRGDFPVISPIDGAEIARLAPDTDAQVDAKITRAADAFAAWRDIPAPRRGELVRLLGDELRAHKDALGRLVTIENGKIVAEGTGEVQEMIDICDFAVGLSRQLYGLTIASERPGHRMMETWHPLGPVGVITAFNFPVAVWSWNFTLAMVCGDPVVWKPSEKTPLTALACQALFARACERFEDAPDGLLEVGVGGRESAARLVDDDRLKLVSATGSTAMGRAVGPRQGPKLGDGNGDVLGLVIGREDDTDALAVPHLPSSPCISTLGRAAQSSRSDQVFGVLSLMISRSR